jgi:hypothetical protein
MLRLASNISRRHCITLAGWVAIELSDHNPHSLLQQFIDGILVNIADDRTGIYFQQGG